jgi:hypothetical protein
MLVVAVVLIARDARNAEHAGIRVSLETQDMYVDAGVHEEHGTSIWEDACCSGASDQNCPTSESANVGPLRSRWPNPTSVIGSISVSLEASRCAVSEIAWAIT